MIPKSISEKLVLSVLVGVGSLAATGSTFAVDEQTNSEFSAWLSNQNKEKFSDTTDQIIVQFAENPAVVTPAGPQAQMATMSTDITVQDSSPISTSVDSLNQTTGMELTFVGKTADDKTLLKVDKALPLDEMKKLADELAARGDILFAEPDPRRFPMAQNTPYGYTAVQADQLSDAGASGMTVCVIDSGYERSNPDLPSGSNVGGTNNSGTGNWYQAGGSHGTHVAGTIAALENDEGIKGILPNNSLNLHIIKVFNADGWAYSSSLTNAITECQQAGAKVVNMSLGGSGSSNSERNALQNIANSGVLLVAAAGNDGDSSFSYPASYDSVVSVGAVDEANQHAEFSQFNSQVELAAPGEAVLSTVAGDGRQGFITYGETKVGDDRVVPQARFVPDRSGNFSISNLDATVTGELAACTLVGTRYTCGDMNEKICVAERADNQQGSNYPEVDPIIACQNAGAEGVIVYSNTERAGLQNPFMVDRNTEITIPTVSVNRTTGQALVAAAGTSATLEVLGNRDYDYYNGTSMASPHVAGVAALAWSNNLDCTAQEVRKALQETALDLGTAGRDTETGFGLVQAKAASDYMAANCGTDNGGDDDNGSGSDGEPGSASADNLSASRGDWLRYTLDVPSGMTNLTIRISGGSGDADLYTRFGAEPSSTTYDCRPYLTGNNETCPISFPQAGTYHIGIRAYSSFSGVSLSAEWQ